MSDDDLTAEQTAAITATVDIEAPPPPDTPTAHIIFGTNQALPATLVAQRYHQGLAPLVIVTGGVNRHNGIVEGQEFLRLLTADGVPAEGIRCEDRSANTWQNIEFAMPHLREAIAAWTLFVEKDPASPLVPRVERKMKRLERRLAGRGR